MKMHGYELCQDFNSSRLLFNAVGKIELGNFRKVCRHSIIIFGCLRLSYLEQRERKEVFSNHAKIGFHNVFRIHFKVHKFRHRRSRL